VQRKAQVVDAALRVIGREGVRGLSMRAVAAEAGVPLGTTTYYFADRDALVEAAFRCHAQRETARVVAAVAAMGPDLSTADLAHRLADFVVAGLTEHRDLLRTEYEFLGEASRRSGLQGASSAFLQTLQLHLEATVSALGSPTPRTDARLVLAVVAGLEVDLLVSPFHPVTGRLVRATFDRLFAGLEAVWST
jgi:DNA-binding transcriptional regulator YbjK